MHCFIVLSQTLKPDPTKLGYILGQTLLTDPTKVWETPLNFDEPTNPHRLLGGDKLFYKINNYLLLMAACVSKSAKYAL